MEETAASQARDTLIAGLTRRRFMQAVGALGSAGVVAPWLGQGAAAASRTRGGRRRHTHGGMVLQPGKGPIEGDHYLPSRTDEVRWGYLPDIDAEPVLRMRSGQTVSVDTVSHEGILEDQGRDPVAFFGEHGVAERKVLDDAIDIAASYDRHDRDFDVDGPHVVTGPIWVEGAEPGDVLKIETLSALLRVPYGVVSSRHGKGALPRQADGGPPPGITLDEVMPPVELDGRDSGDPERYGGVFTFTPVRYRHGEASGVMPAGDGQLAFPLDPFLGIMGVAFTDVDGIAAPEVNSIPPVLGGGNIDIRRLGVGSTFYLPVFAEGALFFTGDPHMRQGNGEVALTAMEGSLRPTFRLTVCKPGSGDAPSVAFDYPFAETDDEWIPIGLSDPDGAQDEQISDLDIAMRRAVVNALDFLEHDLGMERTVAYAYLSAAADFEVSQVVDKTVGVHGVITKSHFS